MRERKWFFLSLILHKISERKLILKEKFISNRLKKLRINILVPSIKNNYNRRNQFSFKINFLFFHSFYAKSAVKEKITFFHAFSTLHAFLTLHAFCLFVCKTTVYLSANAKFCGKLEFNEIGHLDQVIDKAKEKDVLQIK